MRGFLYTAFILLLYVFSAQVYGQAPTSEYDNQPDALKIPHEEAWCSPDGSYTTAGMTPGGTKISCAKDKESQNDVWFKFLATSHLMDLELTPSGANPISKSVVGIYDNLLNELACAEQAANDPLIRLVNEHLEAGQWYYIRVDNAKKKDGDFSICLKNTLSHDFQAGAVEMPHSTSWCAPENTYTTTNMTPGAAKISCMQAPESQNDVWFKFQATSNQIELQVSPSGVNPISKISAGIYDDQLLEMACGRADANDLPVKVISDKLVIGQWYYVRVDNERNSAGDFTICARDKITYDFHLGAVEVPHANAWCSADGAYTTNGMTPEGEKLSCSDDGKSRNDVWFKFQARGEQVEVEVIPSGANPIDRIMAGMYDAALTEVACALYASDNEPVSLTYARLNAGDWYYIRIDNFKDFEGDFKLCIRGGISVPETPTELSIAVDANYVCTISWTDNSNHELGYIIQKNIDKTGFAFLDSIKHEDQTSYEDPLIIPGKDYSYRIIAYNEFGNSEFSNEDSISVPNIIPTPPANLTATMSVPEYIILTWQDNSNNEDGFIIKYKTEFDDEYTVLDTTGTNETTFTHTIRHTGIEYSYIIASSNEVGTSEPANVAIIAVTLDKAKEGNVPDLVEYHALKAIFESTDGSNWVNNVNWLNGSTSAELNVWYGVRIENGDVIRLSLGNNNLTGAVPPELGQLLSIGYIYMANNNISSIPDEIGNLSLLQDLYLGGNELNSLPASIGGLSRLDRLDVNSNNLNSLPDEIGNLARLSLLNAGDNQLSGNFPSMVMKLSRLNHLYLYENQLNGSLPVEIRDLTNLHTLHLGNNQFSGAIPAELGDMSNLMNLYLYTNQLSGPIPVELSQLSNLYLLYLSYNQLSGGIPADLAQLTNLVYLQVGSNRLSGTIPPELGQLSNLRNLDLQHNQLEGTIPRELGQLTDLVYMYFNANQLTGEIPAEFANWTELYDLWVENNKFTFTDILGVQSWFQGTRFQYAPQDSVVIDASTTAIIDEDKLLEALVDRNTTPLSKYQWFKYVENGEDIALTPSPAEDGHTYTISSFSHADSGSYYYKIINDSVPDLILYSTMISTTDIKQQKYFCIGSGNWNDPSIWSSTPYGAPGNSVPQFVEEVYISGHYVVVSGDYECDKIIISNELPGTVLDVQSGKLTVTNRIELLNKSKENGPCELKVAPSGAIEVELSAIAP